MKPIRLVIAMEEPAARLHLRAMLEALGHTVPGEAGDAETGWRLARQLRPDLVILDLTSERDESLEAAQAIRTALDAPVLFVSASSGPDQFSRARQAGCAGYVVRPFTEADLNIALCMALDRHAERQALQRELDELKTKLEARKLINRAKAILMERHGLTEPEAFRRLQVQSMTTATPMKALAEAVIMSSQVLDGETRRRRTTV